MRMDLIQPFIGSLDAVLAEMMNVPAKIVDLTMEEEGYRRKGTAASVCFKGQIEGRVILDMEPRAAAQVAGFLAGGEERIPFTGMNRRQPEMGRNLAEAHRPRPPGAARALVQRRERADDREQSGE